MHTAIHVLQDENEHSSEKSVYHNTDRVSQVYLLY